MIPACPVYGQGDLRVSRFQNEKKFSVLPVLKYKQKKKLRGSAAGIRQLFPQLSFSSGLAELFISV